MKTENEEGKKTVKTWRVRLGNMYYVQGLARLFKNNSQEHNSFEFTTYKEAAWLFPLKFTADNIAESSGGVVEDVEITVEEYSKLEYLREYHVSKSEIEWHREQEKVKNL